MVNKAAQRDKDKREIIRQWFSDNYNQLRTNVFKICGSQEHIMEKWGEDLLPYFIEGFLKRPVTRQWEIFTDGKFENYCTRGMSLALKSKTSPFYHQYRKKGRSFRELHFNYDYGLYEENTSAKKEEKYRILNESIDELHFYDRYLLKLYYIEGLNLEEIYIKTNICTATVSKDIKSALQKLEKILIKKDIIL
jgi:RNA polymerase sigma factor (sigma-70 family)